MPHALLYSEMEWEPVSLETGGEEGGGERGEGGGGTQAGGGTRKGNEGGPEYGTQKRGRYVQSSTSEFVVTEGKKVLLTLAVLMTPDDAKLYTV